MSPFERRPPGSVLLAIGVVFPIVVVLLELATGLCAQAFFDPLPTWGHALAVLMVPAVNLALWRAARSGEAPRRWLFAAAGAAAAVSAAYAILFLPLLPVSLIGILFLGIGLLPQAPALALIATVKLTGALIVDGFEWRRWLGGALLGLVALTLVDLPATATFVALRWSAGDEAGARRGTALMRAAGDEAMLLRLCYGATGRGTGLVSFLVSSWSDGLFAQGPIGSTAAARELYYRATGRAFNAVPAPGRGMRRGRLLAFDEDQGGESVGGQADGLSLAASRLDGSISAADNLGYLEWTASFQNESSVQREARFTLALPAGAVASRATLWVDGEPREASVAGRGAARAAYEKVVTARRDPLLVTTAGGDRLLVQAFPVQPGTSLKLRIGLSAPLEVAPDGARYLALPAIAERNFAISGGLRHHLWVEGDAPVGSRPVAAPGSKTMREAIEPRRLDARPRIWTSRIEAPSTRSALLSAAKPGRALAVSQTLARLPIPKPPSLVILLDGSAGNRAGAAGLKRALDAIPAGLPVELLIAAETPRTVGMAPWSADQKRRVEQALGETGFAGGQDNLGRLADTLDAARGRDSILLWIHGPQPVAFARSQARLEQLLERRRDLPRLVRYQPQTGPAFAIPGDAWFESAREAAPSGNAGADLAALLADLSGGGPRWRTIRTARPAPDGAASSLHIARLWGAEVIEAAAGARGTERADAIALARRLNIVTPLSGAVVLESDDQYAANGLSVPGAADVPTVPEPGFWILLAIVAALLAVLLGRRGRPRFA